MTTPRPVPLRMKMVDDAGYCSRDWGQFFFGVGQGNGQGFAKLQGAFAALAETVNAQALRLDAVETVNATQADTIAQQAGAIAALNATVQLLGEDVEALQMAPFAL